MYFVLVAVITTEEGREKNYADIEAFKAALAASKAPKRKVLWELIDDPAEAQKVRIVWVVLGAGCWLEGQG